MSHPKHIRLLLADDDEDDREFFRHALENLNKKVEISEAANGLEALRLLSGMQEIPHYVFLDINMPLVNGIECLHEIRQMHPPQLLPVIMLSTSGAPHIIEQCMEAGADLYIQKPSSLETLREKIFYCLETVRKSELLEVRALLDS